MTPTVPVEHTAIPVKAGSVVTLLTPDFTLKPATGVAAIYAGFILVTGPTFVVATPVAGGFSVAVSEGNRRRTSLGQQL